VNSHPAHNFGCRSNDPEDFRVVSPSLNIRTRAHPLTCVRRYDVNSWGGMINNAISVNKPLAKYAGPGGWNDMDALIGSTEGTAVHVTPLESRTQVRSACVGSGLRRPESKEGGK
jgi:hypothetical protein